MTFIPFPSGAKTVSNFAFGSFTFSNVLWWTKFGFDTNDLEALAGVVGAGWGAVLKGHFHQDTQYVSTVAYDMQTVFGASVTDVVGAGYGTQNDDAVPLNAALVVTLRTNARGRSARGRVYVGGLTESVYEDGGYNSAIRGTLVTALEDLQTAALALGWTLVVASRQENNVVRSTILGRPVTTITVRRPNPGSRRKRVRRG